MEGGIVQLGLVVTTAAGAPMLCAYMLVEAMAIFGHIATAGSQPP